MALTNVYEFLYLGAIIILAILIFACLIRAILGPSIADRIIAINMIGTMTIMIIAILAVYMNEGYLLDVSIVYALISFLAVVALTKIYMGVYQERLVKQKLKEEKEAKNND